MFIKGYFIANLIYDIDRIDKNVKVMDCFISKHTSSYRDSWGYSLLSCCKNYKESLSLFHRYWDEAVANCNHAECDKNYIRQLQDNLEPVSSYAEFIHIVINQPENIGLIDARDFDMLFTGYMYYGLPLHSVLPSVDGYHISDTTFFSIWGSEFNQFLRKYIRQSVRTRGTYSLSSYCYLLASTSSLKYLCEMLMEFTSCQEN